MAGEGKDIVLFLTRDKLYLYSGSEVLVLDFPPAVISDLDVKDRDGIINLVTAFVKSNEIAPGRIFFILSESVCFSMDFSIKDPSDTSKPDEDARVFLEAVPFSYVVSKTYKTSTFERAVGANQDLIDAVVDALVAVGFSLAALVPANIYPDLAGSTELTAELAKSVLDDETRATKANMIDVGKDVFHGLPASSNQSRKVNYRLFILIGVFAVLTILLAFLIFFRK